MQLTAYLGTTGLADVGYRFIDAAGAYSGARQTAGIYEMPGARGVYGVANATIPADAVAVYWDSTGTAAVYAYEAFDPRLPNVNAGSAGAVLTSGTGTGQLSVTSGVAKANLTQIDGLATNTNAATLNLKALVINNPDGTGVEITSGNAAGMSIAGFATGLVLSGGDGYAGLGIQAGAGEAGILVLGDAEGMKFTTSGFAIDASGSLGVNLGAATITTLSVNATSGAAFTVETGVSSLQAQRIILSTLAGVATGGDTATITFKNPSGASTRAVMTVDANGNRSAVVLTP